MARLNKEALIARAIDAVAADGWAVNRLNQSSAHPARFTMERDGVSHLVRLYIWNLSHGGKSRSASEFRIQVTGIDGFEPEPDGRTLILGWSDDFGVFAGFDVQHRTGALGLSTSIQVTTATLDAARSDGAGKQGKTKGEWAVAVRLDRLARYVQHLGAAHAGDIEPLLAGEDSPFADPVASEIAHLANGSRGFDLGAAGEADLRAQVVADVDEVLAALGGGPPDAPAQIGHNHPPEPIDDQSALGPKIKSAAQAIRRELKSDNANPREVGRAGAFLAWTRKMLEAAKREGAQVLDKGKEMAREYVAKALWGVAGTVGLTFKEEIVEALRHFAGSVLNWLQHITLM